MNNTIRFSLKNNKEREMKKILTAVYDALVEQGYNPINQIVGYIISEDPTYITNHKNARSLICKIDRDELMQTLIKNYLEH
ncbi:MAG: IreB family regulatory phosphoprotein [Clostridiales bacterium]|nr:IreB family regulatory phosphoprotein [Clostridiales bacterium]